MKALWFALFAAISLLTGPSLSSAAGNTARPPTLYHFTVIADNTGQFVELAGDVSINNHGVVAFAAKKRGETNYSVFTGNGGSVNKIGQLNCGAPLFPCLTKTDINDHGTVVFGTPLTDPLDFEHFTLYTGDGGPVTPVAGSTGIFGGTRSINNMGAVPFQQTRSDPPGIYVNDNGTLTLISTFANTNSSQAINDRGRVAFIRRLDSGFSIVTGTGGPLTTMVDTEGIFSYFVQETISILNDGSVGFNAVRDGESVASVFRTDGRSVTTIATPGDSYSNIFQSSFNNRGEVAFLAELPTDGEPAKPVGIFTGPDQVADKVIAIGDPLLGSTVAPDSGIIFSRRSLNDRGEIAFYATLADGRIVIVRACPVR